MTVTEAPRSRRPDIGRPPEPKETILSGQNAIIIGASRDIGGAIAVALAKEGVNFLGVYKNNLKRANRVAAQVDPTRAKYEFLATDITSPAAGIEISAAFTQKFGENALVDFLVLSTSGTDTSVNVEAHNALVSEFLPRMREGGTIILMQSVPGHFRRQLEGIETLVSSKYTDTADAKMQGEESLRQRMREFERQDIRLLVVSPPEVPDTVNDKHIRNIDREARAKHARLSQALGIPHEVKSTEVAEKVVELLKNPNVKSGYTELFGDVEDGRTILENLYGPDAIYVDTIAITHEEDVTRAIGRAIVTQEHARKSKEPPIIDIDSVKELEPGHFQGNLWVTAEHMQGHFNDEKNLLVFPGHKQIRAVTAVVEAVVKSAMPKEDVYLHLHGFESTQFLNRIKPNTGLTIDVQGVNLQEGNGRTFVSIGSVVIIEAHLAKQEEAKDEKDKEEEDKALMTMNDVTFEVLPGEHPRLLSDQMIEGAAQTALLAGGYTPEGANLPLFIAIGPTVFDDEVPQGEGVEYAIEMRLTGKREFEADVVVSYAGRPIGNIEGIKGLTMSKRTAERYLS